jgi:hypothetical protein
MTRPRFCDDTFLGAGFMMVDDFWGPGGMGRLLPCDQAGDTRDAHFRAIFDDMRRMMLLICHNTDNGDGWEGSDPRFSAPSRRRKNYPLAINIMVYAMTQ